MLKIQKHSNINFKIEDTESSWGVWEMFLDVLEVFRNIPGVIEPIEVRPDSILNCWNVSPPVLGSQKLANMISLLLDHGTCTWLQRLTSLCIELYPRRIIFCLIFSVECQPCASRGMSQ